MEISADQKTIILENLHKLAALGHAVGQICDAGEPSGDALIGWQLLFLDIEAAIHQIIEPETTESES